MAAARSHRRRGRALGGAAALLALAGAGWWLASSDTALAVPVPLSLVQHDDLGDRVLLVAREVQGPAPASAPTTPEQLAADLAPRAGLSAGAVDDVAAYAEQAERERSGAGVTDAVVQLDGMSATRELGGPLRVCARVHTQHVRDSGPTSEDVVPWVLTVDPGSQQITAVDVQHRDGAGHTC